MAPAKQIQDGGQKQSQDAVDREHTLTGADSPQVGARLEERTHYAHTRYAAVEDPGVIYFDPRDGREKFCLGNSVDGLEHLDNRVMTSVTIKPYQSADFGQPANRYVVKRSYAELELFNVGDECTPPKVWPKSIGESEVLDGLEEAREFCREHVKGYETAPRRDAVDERLGIGKIFGGE